jgi:FkbM family methyltransferase
MHVTPLIRPLRSSLQRLVYSTATRFFGDAQGYVQLPVLSGPARGLFFRFKLNSNSEGSILAGTYERAVARRLAQICQPGWTVWDCGTFIGYYTLMLARIVGKQGSVVAFEPDPVNFQRTGDNARINGLENVTVVELAIGGPVGELEFVSTHDQTSHLSGTYVGDPQLKGTELPSQQTLIKVRCVSLNDLLRRYPSSLPHFIKLDLEGAESDALVHADELIQACRPILAVELHNPQCDEAMWKFCEKHRYSLVSLNHGGEITQRSQTGGIVLATPKT